MLDAFPPINDATRTQIGLTNSNSYAPVSSPINFKKHLCYVLLILTDDFYIINILELKILISIYLILLFLII